MAADLELTQKRAEKLVEATGTTVFITDAEVFAAGNLEAFESSWADRSPELASHLRATCASSTYRATCPGVIGLCGDFGSSG